MYTEIVKIIEGGLVNDKEKVVNYAEVLARNLEKKGEVSVANRIRSTINNRKGMLSSLDSFASRPVDIDSRMDIVDISNPTILPEQIILDSYSKEAVHLFLDSYRNRDLLFQSGVDVSNTMLLYGPPGCGKTTVAQYISSITGLPLVTARLDGLVSSMLGSTAKNIRKIFEYASKRECILFLDEFDVIAKLRDDKNELGELKRVVNSLLQNIDSFSNDSILIAATNHPNLLDPAIWRRFSTVITLNQPKEPEIEKYLEVLFKNRETNFMLNSNKKNMIISAFIGSSYSDIRMISLNAIKSCILNKRNVITNCDVLKAIYVYKNHSVESEDDYIEFLLHNGATHRELNEYLNIALRKIQSISRQIDNRGV